MKLENKKSASIFKTNAALTQPWGEKKRLLFGHLRAKVQRSSVTQGPVCVQCDFCRAGSGFSESSRT